MNDDHKKDPVVVMLSMEALMPDLPEPARGANFRGGLGILCGDITRVTKIIPLYGGAWLNGEKISYEGIGEEPFRINPKIKMS